MKTVSEDRKYIDYTTPKFGVRIRETTCRSIYNTGNRWEEYGDEFFLPLAAPMINPAAEECLSYDLSMNVMDYESYSIADWASATERDELRAILLGTINPNVVMGVSFR